ncbi:MAG: tagaturonate epimerase family protein [Bacteroidota bacterium]
MELDTYSLGVGDRFGMEGTAQLRAIQKAEKEGVRIVPVWNKSNREHTIIGTVPPDTRKAADAAVRACGWKGAYHVDADHIGLGTVDRFLESCDFYTIDVADFIGKEPPAGSTETFRKAMGRFEGRLRIPGMEREVEVNGAILEGIARKYLLAVREAGKVYRYIAGKKGEGNFIPEVSVDEAESPQTPAELFFILAALAAEGVRLQTIAPKFTGSFLKGIDYVGDIGRFTREFEDDLAVIAHAVGVFDLPRNLKLSVHSGSDKFSLYGIMHRAVAARGAGLHLKTAGTTWLEEVIGLAESGGEGLACARDIYAEAIRRFDELCKPYAAVVRIDRAQLPDPRAVASWNPQQFVRALRHDQACGDYNLHFRQIIHVAFRVAAEMGDRYRGLLERSRRSIEENVTMNLYDRHIRPLFLGRTP